MPLFLLVTGFLTPEERAGIRAMLRPSVVLERLQAAGARGAAPEGEGYGPEVYESVRADEDLR
jgi:hypothetical protein